MSELLQRNIALIETNIKALVDARTGTNKALVTFRSLDVN